MKKIHNGMYNVNMFRFFHSFVFVFHYWHFSLFLSLSLSVSNMSKINLFKKNYIFSGVYGHSSVYHVPTQTFYVFGGYMYGVNRTFVSNKLYAFHYPTHTWSVLPVFEEYNPPRMNLVKFVYFCALSLCIWM